MSRINEHLPEIVTLVVLVLADIAFFFLGFFVGKKVEERKCKPDVTITTEAKKTLKPKASSDVAVGFVTAPIEIATKKPDEPTLPGNSIVLFPVKDRPNSSYSNNGTDSLTLRQYMREHGGDSTLVACVPIRQKVYKDSSYTAYVSGYQANLDSLIIRSKVITETRTKYRRLSVGITGGYGYGLQSKKLEPFIGLGITINLLKL